MLHNNLLSKGFPNFLGLREGYSFPMRGKTAKRILITLWIQVSALAIALLAPTTSQGLSFNSAPATVWGALYAGKDSGRTFYATEGETVVATTRPGDLGLPRARRSTFEITYSNVPDRAKDAIDLGVRSWEGYFDSKVPIKVLASWDRTAPFGVLGTARPGRYFNNFVGAPDKELWYASALANAIVGKDLDPANPEVIIRISAFPFWYYGIDGKPGASQYDLASVVLHEMGHGLGFLSNTEYVAYNGLGLLPRPTPFDAYAQLPDERRLVDLPAPSIEIGTAMVNRLYWSGKKGIAANAGVKPILYTPKNYEEGSSISHLDEATFSKSLSDATMTPNLEAGEVLNAPGTLAEAMIEDMKVKPPAGIAFGIPNEPRNVEALIGDERAIVKFDPPSNARSSQVSSYTITNIQDGKKVTVTESPAIINGLRNGREYSFDVIASNTNGNSPTARSNSVTPEAGWKGKVIDQSADAKFLASATFQGKTVIAYTDSTKGDIKLATRDGTRWSIKTIDGNSSLGGKTSNDVSGYLSLCVSGSNARQRLHLFFTDLTNKDLRYGEYDGKRWRFEVVDGDGTEVQNYEEKVRVRTASDVSVSNACAVTSNGLQVFYRDESQGILLGAVRSQNRWFYEIVDGDKKTGGRTIGDVGFRLRALTLGETVYLLYDSILVVDQNRDATQGEVRMATRSSIYPEDWSYKNLETTGELVAVPGYDISMSSTSKQVFGSWLSSTPMTRPKPDRIKSRLISDVDAPVAGFAEDHGSLSGPLAEDFTGALFGCEGRVCAMSKQSQAVSLIVDKEVSPKQTAVWLKLGRERFVAIGIAGKLTLFAQPSR